MKIGVEIAKVINSNLGKVTFFILIGFLRSWDAMCMCGELKDQEVLKRVYAEADKNW